MAISESLYFTFNGKSSKDFGIINCQVDTGMFQETFLPQRTIRQIQIKGGKTYFQGIDYQNLEMKITFAFLDSWNDELIRDVARWLNSPTFYSPLIFSEQPDRIYYAMVNDSSELIHNGLKQGYVTLTFQCSHPWSFSQVYTSPLFDLSTNSQSGTEISITNNGDIPMFSIVTVQVVSGNSFSITNKSNGGQNISFTGLAIGETLTIDMENEDIKTDLADTYRFDNMTGEFISMVRGVNKLQVVGNVKLQFKYEFRRLQ